jgi:membrane-associated phospholipid phosphatase
VVFLISGWLNERVFKYFINSPRPLDSTPFLASEHFVKRTNGMPSGHAQQTAFSLTFLYMLSGKYWYESWGLFLLTILQRFIFKNHTFTQLVAGSIIGFVLAVATVYALRFTEEKYSASVSKKVDKNATKTTISSDNPATRL